MHTMLEHDLDGTNEFATTGNPFFCANLMCMLDKLAMENWRWRGCRHFTQRLGWQRSRGSILFLLLIQFLFLKALITGVLFVVCRLQQVYRTRPRWLLGIRPRYLLWISGRKPRRSHIKKSQTGARATAQPQLFVKCPAFCKQEVTLDAVKLAKNSGGRAVWSCSTCR